MSTKDPFDYKNWLNEAFLAVIIKTLKTIESRSLTHGHFYYVNFFTQHDKVKLPDYLKASYPENITIVLENQFSNFKVLNDGFGVDLYFNSKLESIFIPFNSIISLLDASTSLILKITHDTPPLPKKEVPSESSPKVIKLSDILSSKKDD